MPAEQESPNSRTLKDEARDLVERLSPDATWDDLMHQIYVRKALESGIADSDAGRTLDVGEVRCRFSLPEREFDGPARPSRSLSRSTTTWRAIQQSTRCG